VLAALASSKVVVVAYAPWTNPMEKVWRKLYQEVLHLHDFRDDWEALKREVERWLRTCESRFCCFTSRDLQSLGHTMS
jgi:hypothetical protein